MSATVDDVTVRPIRESDLPEIVRIDCVAFGRPRPQYFEVLLLRSLKVTGLQISVVAEVDGRVAGYLMGSLYYGEYGIAEPAASIDAIGVDPELRRKRVGHALMRDFISTAKSYAVTRIRTEVEWDDFDLLGFFAREGFEPANRLCIERAI
ncbi:MAG TPA: GNAT family N-acetyltransferase [Thermoanaerobaculia bacterium]|nr:GNAT family N-acetyltransferase [Thermoanaerobaculia bacterium]